MSNDIFDNIDDIYKKYAVIMACVINAKVTPVLVGWQKNSFELAKKYNIKYVLTKMWDLNEII